MAILHFLRRYSLGSGRFLLPDLNFPRFLATPASCSIDSWRSKRSISYVPFPSDIPSPNFVKPHTFCTATSTWLPFKQEPGWGSLGHGFLLRIVSWNIDFMAPGRGKRAFTAMSHLKRVFGDPPPPLVVMLQEVHCESLPAILGHSWIRQNFVVSDVKARKRSFTIMMVSRHVPTDNWFRVPFGSPMKTDALVVDVPIPVKGQCGDLRALFRLCTTHLESGREGSQLRPQQLAQISALLKAPSTQCARILGGVVGGDMNSFAPHEAMIHQATDVDLCDAWEDGVPLPAAARNPLQRDLTFGRAEGITWGYQSRVAQPGKRLDKFLYTGSLNILPLRGMRGLSEKVGRLGIDVKTKVKVGEYKHFQFSMRRGMLVEVSDTECFGAERKCMFNGKYSHGDCHPVKDVEVWVSDHFGIAIGVRVPQSNLNA